MTRTALLCVVVGRYTIFWDRFYDSARAHLLKDHIKDFFVFTDQPDFFAPYVADDQHIHVQAIANEGWPNVVLNCHHYFLLQEKALSQCDYLLFFNINLIFNTDIGDEILPPNGLDLTVTLHPGFFDKSPDDFTYERRPESAAYIPYGTGKYYFTGALSGGRSGAYLDLCRELVARIDRDRESGIIAIWHDESHLNAYMLDRECHILSPSYFHPEGAKIPYAEKITVLDKRNYGGHDFLRGIRRRPPVTNVKAGFRLLWRLHPGSAAAMGWRNEKVWTRAGYAVTVLWVLGILLATDGDTADPLFDFIFIVPLGMWMVGLAIARLTRRRD